MKIISRLIQEVKNVLYEFFVHLKSIPQTVTNNVPFVCQFATPQSAELSLTKKLEAIKDPQWADTGASSSTRYAEWAFTMCGMASALMALKHFKKDPSLKIAQLAEEALEYGVYIQGASEISSMKYREFSAWIEKYGLEAHIYTRLSLRGIKYALSQGRLVIVSVNPNIRGYNTASIKQKGGHLVLVTGYDLKSRTISINNPSGFLSTDTQVNHALPFKNFCNYYAGRGIIISSQ